MLKTAYLYLTDKFFYDCPPFGDPWPPKVEVLEPLLFVYVSFKFFLV